jgi:HAD superfamily hydrolase (TIGR01549 family)
MIKAVTFDLWDTLVIDDSDEQERLLRGLGSKAEVRRDLFVGELMQWCGVAESVAEDGLNHAVAWFNRKWKAEHVTPSIRERLIQGFEYVGFEPTPTFDKLVERFARMEVEVPPKLCPNVEATLRALKGKYKLGIISDAIVTPGKELREMLGNHGIAHYFDDFVFSDEAGRSKPDGLVFELAADGLDVDISEIVHIGDRESNDIFGAIRAGARAVLYTGAVDRGSAETKAHAVCGDLAELPAIVERLSRTAR